MIDEAVCQRIISAILADEGGVADVGDGAGVTRWGQTAAWLTDWSLPVPTSRDEAAANYRRWLLVTRLDELTGYGEPLAHAVIDAAVNQGLPFAIRALQGAVQCPQDGMLGEVTLKSLAHSDATRVAYKVLLTRMSKYVSLCQAEPTKYLRYLGGWTQRVFRQVVGVSGVTL